MNVFVKMSTVKELVKTVCKFQLRIFNGGTCLEGKVVIVLIVSKQLGIFTALAGIGIYQ